MPQETKGKPPFLTRAGKPFFIVLDLGILTWKTPGIRGVP